MKHGNSECPRKETTPDAGRRASMRPPRQKAIPFWCGVLAIFLLALSIRLLACWELRGLPAVTAPAEVTDMATYKTMALAIRQGNWPAVFDYQPFYYTVFLPLAYLLSPTGGAWAPMILQALLGATTCVLAANAAARLFGRRAGWLAGILLALSRMHVFYTPFLLLEVCFAFWTALALYGAIRFLERLSWKWAILTGLASSGALLTRGSALLWIPGILAIAIWRGRRTPKALLPALAAFLISFLLPILPYSIHNSRAMGHLCGPSVAGGKVLSLGNSPEAPAGGLEYPRTYFQWNQDEEDGKQTVFSHILHWAKKEPGAFLELEARSLLLFWDHVEIPNNVSLEVEGQSSKVLQFLLPWGLLGALGLAGLLLTCRSSRSQRLVATWLTLAFWGATSAFYLLARFRVGFLPLLAVAASGGIAEVGRRIQKARRAPTPQSRNRLAMAAIALLAAVYVVDFAHDTYCENIMPAVFRTLRPAGLAMDFPTEQVLYDHGPLGFGGTVIAEFSNQDTTIQKSFHVPEDFQVDAPVTQVILLRIFAPALPPENIPVPATLAMDGIPQQAISTWHQERSAQWLRFEFTAALPENPTYTITVPNATLFSQWGFALDTQRDYHRTSLNGETLPAEAVVELVLPKTRTR